MVNIFGEKQDAMTLDKILKECLKREPERLTENQKAVYTELFYQYDEDNDMRLNKKEYKNMLQEYNLTPVDKDIEEIMRNDSNHNINGNKLNQVFYVVLMIVLAILYNWQGKILYFLVLAILHSVHIVDKSEDMDESVIDLERFLKDVRGTCNPFLNFNEYVDINPEKNSKIEKQIRLMRGKFVDQVINRLSSLYGHTYLGCDQAPKSMYSKSFEYIFGATYEQQTDKRNSKVRILIMEKKKLKYLAEKLIDTDFKHSNIEAENSNKYLEYCLTREKHLKLLWQIYEKQKKQDEIVSKRERKRKYGKLHLNEQEREEGEQEEYGEEEEEQYNYLVGRVYINQLIELGKK